MIDLCISGSLEKDTIVFTVDSETKTIDQFSRNIHFSLDDNRTYRIYFEQKSERYIPRCVEMWLELLFLPIRGIFNIITFNVDQNWEKDISAYRVSGYIDVNLNKNTEISFELKHGKFDKKESIFYEPTIAFSPSLLTNQSITVAPQEVSRKHNNFLQNIASVSMLFFALFLFLLIEALNNKLYVAFIFALAVMIAFGILVGFLVTHSFKKKRHLLMVLSKQQINR